MDIAPGMDNRYRTTGAPTDLERARALRLVSSETRTVEDRGFISLAVDFRSQSCV